MILELFDAKVWALENLFYTYKCQIRTSLRVFYVVRY